MTRTLRWVAMCVAAMAAIIVMTARPMAAPTTDAFATNTNQVANGNSDVGVVMVVRIDLALDETQRAEAIAKLANAMTAPSDECAKIVATMAMHGMPTTTAAEVAAMTDQARRLTLTIQTLDANYATTGATATKKETNKTAKQPTNARTTLRM